MLNVEFQKIQLHLAWGPFDSTKAVFYQVSSALLEDGDRALLEDEWKFVKHLPMLSVSSTIHWRLNYGSGTCMSRALGCCLLEKNVWVNAGSNGSPWGDMGSLEKARKIIIILRGICVESSLGMHENHQYLHSGCREIEVRAENESTSVNKYHKPLLSSRIKGIFQNRSVLRNRMKKCRKAHLWWVFGDWAEA